MTTCLEKLYVSFVKFCVCPSFPFGTEGGIWDVIVLIPDHCLSICFSDALCTWLALPYRHAGHCVVPCRS